LCTCRRHYPGAASERIASLISSRRISLPRKGCRVDLRIVLFEACSAFTRVAACTLALSPICDTLIEGFSHFVTSMTAPIASGWSGCRMGFAPTGKRRLCTAHPHSGHSISPIPRFSHELASGSKLTRVSVNKEQELRLASRAVRISLTRPRSRNPSMRDWRRGCAAGIAETSRCQPSRPVALEEATE
jgi:hypothetical protein